jgi:CheY-like chemotaxis protein
LPDAILIVDDNAAIRSLLRSLLEKAGFSVCGEAESGTRAIESASRLKPDLILLDYSMPGMNGAETASVLKSHMPEVPIILFTLHADDVGESFKRAVHVDAVLRKSDGMDNLLITINRLLQRKSAH